LARFIAQEIVDRTNERMGKPKKATHLLLR